MMERINQAMVDFIAFGVERGYIHPMDQVVRINQLLVLLNLDEVDDNQCPSSPLPEAKTVLPILIEDAIQRGVIGESTMEQEQFRAQVMAILTPDPSVLNVNFWQKYADRPELATDYFYQLSQDNDYIQTEAISKNIAFDYESDYGKLDITINLSKPEKDPKSIAAERHAVATHYPKCALCIENEGFKGTATKAARANHRIIRFPLKDETWGLQYSPYAYYPEHCIFLSEEHRPMSIGHHTFENLLEIVTVFPHYFVGSNADLPIVGGSILSHDHYQGGRYTFAMETAPVETSFEWEQYPDLSVGLVHWPMSVIRLEGTDKSELVAAATEILDTWRTYSDEEVAIVAETDGIPHNTITPIARRKDDRFVLDLVLRNNRTTSEHPDGLFHPHQDVQHIKKENIGLIEVMGLAILPPRLKNELDEVANYLTGQTKAVNPIHQKWADSLSKEKLSNPMNVIETGVGVIFQRVLEDAGVFKQDRKGTFAFERFIQTFLQ